MSMLKIDNRESAHIKSRVKDLSVVPNVVSYTGLFACITPLTTLKANDDGTGTFNPVLIRDVDSLIQTFGDPRLDPEKYIDLYSIMQAVGNGATCYIAKVPSGQAGEYELALINEKDYSKTIDTVTTKYLVNPDEYIALNNQDTPILIASNTEKLKKVLTTNNRQTWKSEPFFNKYANITLKYATLDGDNAKTQNLYSDDTGPSIKFQATHGGKAGNNLSVVIARNDSNAIFTLKVNDENIDGTNTIPKKIVNDKITVEPNDFSPWAEYVTLECTGGETYTISAPENNTVSICEFTDGSDTSYVIDQNRISSDNYTISVLPYDQDFVVQVNFNQSVEDKKYIDKCVVIDKCEFDEEWLPDGDQHGYPNASDDLKVPLAKLTLNKKEEKTDGTVEYSNIIDSNDPKLKHEYIVTEINGNSDLDNKFTFKNSGGELIVTLKQSDIEYNLSSIPNKIEVTKKARKGASFVINSAMNEDITFKCSLTQARPKQIKAFYLNIDALTSKGTLAKAKIKLDSTTTNQAIINNINSSIGSYCSFSLANSEYADSNEQNDSEHSIVYILLSKYAAYKGAIVRSDLTNESTPLNHASAVEQPVFNVTLQNYVDTYNLLSDKRYPGCLMADLTAPMHWGDDTNDEKRFGPPSESDRRSLHYYLKQAACLRKDCNVILSTPYAKNLTPDVTPYDINTACDWVAARGDFADLWEYGVTNTTDYSEQSFYLEMYYSWLDMKCAQIKNGVVYANAKTVLTAPSNFVINNVLRSYRERGTQYPVAGDQYGTLPESCTIKINPDTKLKRDQLVQDRINPIYDTGTRGIQIYGNETLNAGYTDLNAAHIARTLVNIRNSIDEYTETLKFLINSQILWDTWKTYVSNYILEPLRASNALASYTVAMGTDTTSAAEIANRKINGQISLIFYQSAEVFDLEFTVYSSATTFE